MTTEFILTNDATPEQMEKLHDAFKAYLRGPAISTKDIADAVNKAISGTLCTYKRFDTCTIDNLRNIAKKVLNTRWV